MSSSSFVGWTKVTTSSHQAHKESPVIEKVVLGVFC